MKNITLKDTLSRAAALVITHTPRVGVDTKEVADRKVIGRDQFKIDQAFLVSNPIIMEKLLFRVYDIFSKSKTDESILQACLMRDLPFCETTNQSLFTSARALYLLGQTDLLEFSKFKSKSGHTYFKIKAGSKFPTSSSEVKRVAKKAAKKNKRLALTEPTLKIARNNKNGFFDFEEEFSENMNKAIIKLQNSMMRLYIPDGMSYKEVAVEYMGVDETDVLYLEVIAELTKFNGKTFYVSKSGCRAERIYGSKHLDISAKSTFRPFLRLARKRKVSKAGADAYKRYVDAERDDFIKDGLQWFVDELDSIKAGDFTNVMIEIDGNNQGPSIIAAVLQDKEQFLKYWDNKDSKMYDDFKIAILSNLGLPLDTLVSKDVKYKIMTKPYNKMDESNIFGGKEFLAELDSSITPGLVIAKYDFFELPLKIQLQIKLAEKYNFTDEQLTIAYKAAVMSVAPFLEQFKAILDDFQDNCKYVPSVWEWDSFDGDAIKCARSKSDSIKVEFFDVFGGEHSFTYQFSRLIKVGEFGGNTALSPTWIASIDAWLARQLIILFKGDIFSNHDAFFVHGNDEEQVLSIYKDLFSQIPGKANEWLRDMGSRYMNQRIKPITTFFGLASFGKDVERLTTDEILNSSNLVGY